MLRKLPVDRFQSMRWSGALLAAIGILLGYVASRSTEITEGEKQAAGLLDYYRDTVLGFQAYESGDINCAFQMKNPELREGVLEYLRRGGVGSDPQEMRFEVERFQLAVLSTEAVLNFLRDERKAKAWRSGVIGVSLFLMGAVLLAEPRRLASRRVGDRLGTAETGGRLAPRTIRRLIGYSAIGVALLGFAYFGWVLPRLSDWLGPQEETVLKTAFVDYMRQSPPDGIVYLSCKEIDWRKLVSAIPWRFPTGVVFAEATSFKAGPDRERFAAWRDPASGRHFQFLAVSLGSVSLTRASVVMSWHYAPMAGGYTAITLEKGWRGWEVTKRESKGTI